MPSVETHPELIRKIAASATLPTLPAVALQIIELGQQPEADIASVARIISIDPAIVAKILRVANSPLYSRHRHITNLRQALSLLGINGTITLALSFSLVRTIDPVRKGGLDYARYWKRSLASAVCARLLGKVVGLGVREDLFLGGLIQDIGMPILDRTVSTVYQALGDKAQLHETIIRQERETIGTDHASIGAWLLRRWNLPESIVSAVEKSHEIAPQSFLGRTERIEGCIAAASALAEVWVREDRAVAVAEAAEKAERFLDIKVEDLGQILTSAAEEVNAIRSVFDIDIVDLETTEGLLEQAKEVLMLRNLQLLQHSEEISQAAHELEYRTKRLEEQTRRDALTQLFGRRHFDSALVEEFRTATAHGWPLGVAFIDIDYFKKVNDTYGHLAGDEVLRGAAKALRELTRTTDVVARYGGEEFVVLLPGTARDGVKVAADRIVNGFRRTKHPLSSGESVSVTVSVGVAILDAETPFESSDSLLKAADEALYAAKAGGRNCHRAYGTDEQHALKQTSSKSP